VHTPGHAVVNTALLGACFGPALAPPLVAGAVIADLPILALYADARLRRRLNEAQIWGEVYQQRFWQDLIHGLHSFPLCALGLGLGLISRSQRVTAFFASMLLHALADFPIHAEDAHRHFWPLSQYRFISPISDWDVRRHAKKVALVEMALVWVACAVLWVWPVSVWIHVLLVFVFAYYAREYGRLWTAPARPYLAG
jgi:hypothetical protein